MRLVARGWKVHLATDDRAERFAGHFPAAAVHPIASATIGSAQSARAGRCLLDDLARRAAGLRGDPPHQARRSSSASAAIRRCRRSTRRRGATCRPSIHEQNAVMGRANKALAATRRRRSPAASWRRRRQASAAKTVVTGNPVRPAVLEAAATPYAPSRAGEPFRLLVFGGSQGAQFFSDAVPAAIAALARGAARAAARHAAGARRGRRPGQGRLCRARRRGAGAALLHRHGGADRGRASGHLALRRLDRFGDRRDRPAGAAGALSAMRSTTTRRPMRRRLRRPAARRCMRSRRSRPSALAELIGGADGRSRPAGDDGRGGEIRRETGRGAVARRPGRGYCVGQVGSGIQEGSAAMKMPQTHRPGAFHRHRRHRHERHRRGAAQSRLPRAGVRPGRQRQCAAAARQGHRVLHRPPRREPRRRRSRRRLDRDQEDPIRNSRRRAKSCCRSCGAPRCWPN